METQRQVVLSGIRATGRMHLGNYLGVLERCADLSRDQTKKCFYFIADFHTLTTHKEAELIRTHAPEIVLDMLAAGVDHESATIYVQSHAPEVTELAWYLSCLSPVGDLERMPTYKDKATKHPDDVNAGLFFYPVLMAADILGPRANLVPVGTDQKPHLEFAQELATRFNHRYGDLFPIPGEMDGGLLIPGLTAMNQEGCFGKMGKSETPQQTIYLNDPWEASWNKIRRAPTDPARMRRTDPGTPQKCVVFTLHGHLSSEEEMAWSATGCSTAGISCLECKEALARNIQQRLAKFWEKRRELTEHPERVTEIIEEGGRKARAVFAETTAEVADRMGVFRTKRMTP